jgi:hypothetical protein
MTDAEQVARRIIEAAAIRSPRPRPVIEGHVAEALRGCQIELEFRRRLVDYVLALVGETITSPTQIAARAALPTPRDAVFAGRRSAPEVAPHPPRGCP